MNKRTAIQRLSIGLPVVMLAMFLSVCAAQTNIAAAQIASPTPTGSQIQLPTSTSTQVGGPTVTPSRTASVAPVTAQVIEEANLRTLPSIDADIVATLEGGTTLPVVGRWVGYNWLLVAWTEAQGGQAWVHDSVVTIIGDITTVPAVTPPPQATIEPTQAALNATSTVILQTPGAAETATAAAFFAPSGVYTVTPGSAAIAGVMPTFTPPEPYVQPETLAAPEGSMQSRRGPAPAVLIIALGAMGLLTLIVGLLRRL